MIFPQSPEIEVAVIGQLIQNPNLLKKAGLKESDFEKSPHRRIYRAMEELFHKSKGFDIPLLAEKLSKEDLVILDGAGSETFSRENFPIHVSKLKEASSKRSLQYLALEIIRGLGDRTLEESILKAKRGLSEILQGQGADSITAAEMAAAGWKRIEDRASRKGTLSGIPCGLRCLDDHLDGFQECELTIIAARPGIGKTAFSLHCLLTAAQAGFPGAFLSLEMGWGQITDRLHSTLSGIPLWKIRRGLLGPEEWEKITDASNTFNSLPVRFVFDARNLKDVISTIIGQVENHGVKILFLDYLQLIKAEGAQNREREISLISGEMKSLSKALKVPVVALSQLSRNPERREDKRPNLADLRDSGSLEQDADNVILLYREDLTQAEGAIDFIVAKGRNTGVGTFTGYFEGEIQKFLEE